MNLEEVRQAKASFLRVYADHPHINGVGLTNGPDGYRIKVNVTAEGAVLPHSFQGVPVHAEFVGPIEAAADRVR